MTSEPSTAGRLDIGPNLSLPLEAVTETFAILGKRGKGKTATGVVLAEELIGADLPVVVLDPVGVWWGLRADASGDRPGLPVVIFGGDHADVPLEPGSGGLVADVIVDERVPAVLDLSGLSKTKARRVATEFVERLYQRNRAACHVIVDEADAFAPQRAGADGARLLGAMEDLVRRGRARGLGATLITQRPAVLHKDVLTQAEVLVALGMTGPRDVAAIDEWVRLHADEDDARAVKASLPSLPVGTSWWWSPGWLDVLARVQVRRRWTFDSSATPRPGETRPTVERMADVDLARITERMADVVEQATATDPKALRQRIADLERELAAASDTTPRVERVEVPVLEASLAERLEHWAADVRELADALTTAAAQVADRVATAVRPGDETVKHSSTRAAPAAVRDDPPPAARSPHQNPDRTATPVAIEAAGEGPALKAGARRILDVLARHPRALTRAQLATLSRFKASGGTYGTYLSALRRNGMISEDGGLIGLTERGRAHTGATGEPATTAELLEQWRGALKAGARAMLDHLVAVHPGSVTRAELAAATGYEATGGTYGTYLSALRSNGLAETTLDGSVIAADVLFSGAHR